MGAALAGHYDELAESLTRYGDPLGEAFQLRDDLLGAFGDETATGKPVGDDLREGKPTPLLAAAASAADAEQAAVLGQVGYDLDRDTVAEIQSVLVATGAVDAIESRVERLVAEAIAAIEASALTAEARHALVDLARYVAHRRA